MATRTTSIKAVDVADSIQDVTWVSIANSLLGSRGMFLSVFVTFQNSFATVEGPETNTCTISGVVSIKLWPSRDHL